MGPPITFTNNTFTPPTGSSLEVHTSVLPGNTYAVIKDFTNLQTFAYSFNFEVFDQSGTMLWTYPTSGNAAGYLTALKEFDSTTPIYGYGVLDDGTDFLATFINKLLVGRINHAPADYVVPLQGGDAFTTAMKPGTHYGFLEHLNTIGVFDYGEEYQFYAFHKPMVAADRNSVVVLGDTIAVSGNEVQIDRHTSGVDIFAANPSAKIVSAGQHVTLTLLLNDKAPASGVKLGLTCKNPALKFSQNNETKLNIVVPSGQSSITVDLVAQSVAGNTDVDVLTISQDGVRLNLFITVTP